MIGSPSKKGIVERYAVQDPLTGKDVLMYKWKYCRAMVYENPDEKWATVSLIETHQDHRNQGQATEMMNFLKMMYEKNGFKFWGTVALNPAMKRVYEKTGIKEYVDDSTN